MIGTIFREEVIWRILASILYVVLNDARSERSPECCRLHALLSAITRLYLLSVIS